MLIPDSRVGIKCLKIHSKLISRQDTHGVSNGSKELNLPQNPINKKMILIVFHSKVKSGSFTPLDNPWESQKCILKEFSRQLLSPSTCAEVFTHNQLKVTILKPKVIKLCLFPKSIFCILVHSGAAMNFIRCPFFSYTRPTSAQASCLGGYYPHKLQLQSYAVMWHEKVWHF